MVSRFCCFSASGPICLCGPCLGVFGVAARVGWSAGCRLGVCRVRDSGCGGFLIWSGGEVCGLGLWVRVVLGLLRGCVSGGCPLGDGMDVWRRIGR